MRNKISLSLNKKHLLFVGYQHCSTPKLFEILTCFLSNSAVAIIEGIFIQALPPHLRTQTTEDVLLIKIFFDRGRDYPHFRDMSEMCKSIKNLARGYM